MRRRQLHENGKGKKLCTHLVVQSARAGGRGRQVAPAEGRAGTARAGRDT